MEVTLETVNPFSNTIDSDFDSFENDDLRMAFINNDKLKINLLRNSYSSENYLVFISVNKLGHALVLLLPNISDELTQQNRLPLPLQGIELLNLKSAQICIKIQLQFKNVQQKWYQVTKSQSTLQSVEENLHKTYFIGYYENINIADIQLSAMKSAPKRYRALLEDCVKFSQNFCANLVAYTSNYKTLEESVDKNLYKISSTGLSIEVLSRKYNALGYTGNFTLVGPDATTWLGYRYSAFTLAGLVIFVLIWPILCAYLMNRCK